MNELEKAMSDYEEALRKEHDASMVKPAVCIAGKFDCILLQEALKWKFGVWEKMAEIPTPSHFTYNNVQIFLSSSFERGFYFGIKEVSP